MLKSVLGMLASTLTHHEVQMYAFTCADTYQLATLCKEQKVKSKYKAFFLVPQISYIVRIPRNHWVHGELTKFTLPPKQSIHVNFMQCLGQLICFTFTLLNRRYFTLSPKEEHYMVLRTFWLDKPYCSLDGLSKPSRLCHLVHYIAHVFSV